MFDLKPPQASLNPKPQVLGVFPKLESRGHFASVHGQAGARNHPRLVTQQEGYRISYILRLTHAQVLPRELLLVTFSSC